jgi:hypothetical protein
VLLLHAAPVRVEVVRTLPLHVGGGSTLHVTPAHGSGLQAALAHPKLHIVSAVAYVQLPALHVPGLTYFLSVFVSAQIVGGGEAQGNVRHGSVEQAFPRHVHVTVWEV